MTAEQKINDNPEPEEATTMTETTTTDQTTIEPDRHAPGSTTSLRDDQRPAEAARHTQSAGGGDGAGDRFTKLRPGQLACAACGQATRAVDKADPHLMTVEPTALVGTVMGQRVEREWRSGPVELTRCPSCAKRAERAVTALELLPDVARRYGRHAAEHRLTSALDALAALGLEAPKALGHEAVMHLLHSVAGPGAGAHFVQLLQPATRHENAGSMASARPWAHLDAEDRQALNEGRGKLMAYRVAATRPGVEVTAPDLAPCLLCGRGALAVSAVRLVSIGGVDLARNMLWTERRAQARSLGINADPSRKVNGYTCHPCSRAITEVGGVGLSAVERAVKVHLRAEGHAGQLDPRSGTLEGLAAFAAVRDGRGANATPWEHLDLGTLAN